MDYTTHRQNMARIIRAARRAGLSRAVIDHAEECASACATGGQKLTGERWNVARWYEDHCNAFEEYVSKVARRTDSGARYYFTENTRGQMVRTLAPCYGVGEARDWFIAAGIFMAIEPQPCEEVTAPWGDFSEL